MSHFGNNFAIKVTQLIYAGGADKGFMVIVLNVILYKESAKIPA